MYPSRLCVWECVKIQAWWAYDWFTSCPYSMPCHTSKLSERLYSIFSILLTFCVHFSAVSHMRTVNCSTVKRNSMKNLCCMMTIPHVHLVNHRKKSGSVVAVLQKEKISGRKWRSGLMHAEHSGAIHGLALVGKRKSLQIQFYCIQRACVHVAFHDPSWTKLPDSQ